MLYAGVTQLVRRDGRRGEVDGVPAGARCCPRTCAPRGVRGNDATGVAARQVLHGQRCVHAVGRSLQAALLRNTASLNTIMRMSLVDMYAKCSCVDKAAAMFDITIAERLLKHHIFFF